MAFAAVFVFVIWMYQVRLFIALMLGTKSFVSFRDFLLVVITTPEGWIFLIVEHLIGAVLSFLLFSLTVVSFPLLLDRDVDIVTAMITSVRAVVASPGPMIGWAAVIVFLLIVACLPAFLGLLVVLPVLGHATWTFIAGSCRERREPLRERRFLSPRSTPVGAWRMSSW